MATQNRKTIEELRNLLFTTIERVLDKDNPLDAAQAKAIANNGRVMVDTAKVEIEFMKNVGGFGSGFITNNRLPEMPELAKEATT